MNTSNRTLSRSVQTTSILLIAGMTTVSTALIIIGIAVIVGTLF